MDTNSSIVNHLVWMVPYLGEVVDGHKLEHRESFSVNGALPWWSSGRTRTRASYRWWRRSRTGRSSWAPLRTIRMAECYGNPSTWSPASGNTSLLKKHKYFFFLFGRLVKLLFRCCVLSSFSMSVFLVFFGGSGGHKFSQLVKGDLV